jgi:hypothetical protein
MLQVKDMLLWFWYAVDSETRMIVHWKISWKRTNTTLKSSSKRLNRDIERKQSSHSPMVGLGTRFYLGLDGPREAIAGGIMSYVERVIETVKDRTRLFD